MKNKNKRKIYNVEAAPIAAAPNNPFCPNGGYTLPKSCKPPVAAKCKVLCDQIGPEITELNKQCGIEAKFRTDIAALVFNKNDLTLGNLIQTYIDAIGPNKVNKALEAIRKHLNSNTVKGNKSVNLWNLALWNLANAKGGKGGKGGKGKNDGGKGPNNSKKDKNDKKNNKDKNDKNNNKAKNNEKSKAKNNENQKKDKKDKDSKAKNNDNSNSGASINEKTIIALIEKRRKDNKLLEDAKNKVKATEDKLRDKGCITTTTTPAPTTTPPPTSLAPQTKIPNGKRDIWFLNPSAKNRRHK